MQYAKLCPEGQMQCAACTLLPKNACARLNWAKETCWCRAPLVVQRKCMYSKDTGILSTVGGGLHFYLYQRA